MKILIRDVRFWSAVVLVVKAVLFYVFPDFPQPIWTAVDGLIAVVLGVLAGYTARQVMLAARWDAARAAQGARMSRAKGDIPRYPL